jgi:hypothetical protein
LLWLALTAIALSSLASSGAGAMAGARLVVALSAGATGKLKANTLGAPGLVPREANRNLPQQVHGPDGDAKRIQESGSPAGFLVQSESGATPLQVENASLAVVTLPVVRPRGAQARAPPGLA